MKLDNKTWEVERSLWSVLTVLRISPSPRLRSFSSSSSSFCPFCPTWKKIFDDVAISCLSKMRTIANSALPVKNWRLDSLSQSCWLPSGRSFEPALFRKGLLVDMHRLVLRLFEDFFFGMLTHDFHQKKTTVLSLRSQIDFTFEKKMGLERALFLLWCILRVQVRSWQRWMMWGMVVLRYQFDLLGWPRSLW